MIKVKNQLLAVSMALCLLLGTTGCAHQPLMASMAGGGAVPVESMILETTPVAISGVYQANLISRYSVSLQPQVSGQIAEIHVKAGDRVKAGQLLMVIDKRKQEAALNSSEANAASLQAAVVQAESMLNNYLKQREALQSNLATNKKLYERYKALYEKRSVSQQDLEKYTDSYTKAKADFEANEAQIQAQKATINTAKSNYKKALYSIKEQEVQLQYYKITAPYAGIIGDIPVKVGEQVNTNTQLLSITQNDTLEINVNLPVEKVFDIKVGLPVEVLDNQGKVIASTNISFVSPKVDTSTQTILVKANLVNKTGILKADQSVKVRVIYNKTPGILVPTGAVSHAGGQDFAYVVENKDGKIFAKQQLIKLGELQGDKYVVISGLKSGDEIITGGIQKIMDGAPVTIVKGAE